MSVPTKLDARQIVYRDQLQQLFPYMSGQQLDDLLNSIDSDLTSPLRVNASSTPDLVVSIDSSIVSNSVSSRQRSITFIGNVIPTFSSGTVTFPSSDGGTVVVSPGSNITLSCPSNDYVKILLALDTSGNLVVTQGVSDPVSANAFVPTPSASTLPFAYVSLFNNAGTIENVQQDKIFQLAGGSGGGSATSISENFQTVTSYTFVPSDAGKLVSFNNASATMVTVPLNSSVPFPLGTRIEVINNGVGSVKVVPEGGVTIKSLNGLTLLAGEYAQVTLIKTTTDAWYLYGELTSDFIVATGGTITTDGNFKIHTFLTSDTFQIISGIGLVDSLVIAGGGGGGQGNDGFVTGGGGGGAGGMRYTVGTTYGTGGYSVVVGAGGTSNSGNGSNSAFDVFTATGGGGGGTCGSFPSGAGGIEGQNGGSGGGARYVSAAVDGVGGLGTGGQGNNGGTSDKTGGNPGAGGGAGAVGGNGTGTSVGAVGGAGALNSITGTAITYAGGGGGGGYSTTGSGGAGGAGGGGAGGTVASGTAGTPNTGGGGGGGSGQTIRNGGSGGSGIVIVRYQYQ